MKSYLIMMAVRLLELGRVLKPTGSIYLHCDPTASAYLRQLMDVVFGVGSFYTEITWKRSNVHNDRTFGSVSDTILYYGQPPKNEVRIPLDPGYVSRMYRHRDKRGRYNRMGDLT